MENFIFLHNSQWIPFLTQSCLVLYFIFAGFLHSLIIWLTVSSFFHISFTVYSVTYYRSSLNIISSHDVVLCISWKRFTFSLGVSLSLACLGFQVCRLTILSLEVSIRLLSSPFLFLWGFCFFVYFLFVWGVFWGFFYAFSNVANAVTGCCN